MADVMFSKMSKQKWYRLSIYINVILFFIVGLSIYFLIRDCLYYNGGNTWLYITRDIAFLAIVLTLIAFQFFANLRKIMRRSL